MKFSDFIEIEGDVFTLRLAEEKTVQDLLDYCKDKTGMQLVTLMHNILKIPTSLQITKAVKPDSDADRVNGIILDKATVRSKYETIIPDCIQKFDKNKSIDNIKELYESMSYYQGESYVYENEEHYFNKPLSIIVSTETKEQEKAREALEKKAKEAEKTLQEQMQVHKIKLETLDLYMEKFLAKDLDFFFKNRGPSKAQYKELYNAFKTLHDVSGRLPTEDIKGRLLEDLTNGQHTGDIQVRITNVCKELHKEKVLETSVDYLRAGQLNTLFKLFHEGEDKFKAAFEDKGNAAKVYDILKSYAFNDKIPHEKQQELKNNKPFIDKICSLLPEFMQKAFGLQTHVERHKVSEFAKNNSVLSR